MELSYVVLNVEDVDKVKTWYVQVLELSVVLQSRDSVTLAGKTGGAALEIRKGRPLDHPERVSLAFFVEDVKMVFKRLSDSKLPGLTRPRSNEHGRVMVTLKDPAGHSVEIFMLDDSALRQGLSLRGRA